MQSSTDEAPTYKHPDRGRAGVTDTENEPHAVVSIYRRRHKKNVGQAAICFFYNVAKSTSTHKLPVRRRSQDSEATDEVVVDGHHGARVVELSAVVRGREQRHQLSIRLELVAVLDDLPVRQCRLCPPT